MSIPVALLVLSTNMVHPSSGHVGPALWQGSMMILMLPTLIAFFWAWAKEPILPANDRERALKKKWVRIRNGVAITYVLIGVALAIWLICKGY